MLKFLRYHTKTIVWVVVLSFLLWGGYAFSVSLQKKGRMAGELFGKDVSFREYDTLYKANQIFAFGGKKPPEDPSLLHIQTWQSLMFSYEAKNKRVQISDQEVRDEIARLMKELKIENPTNEFYQRWVESSFRMTPQEFENAIREVLRIQKLISQFNEATLPAPSEAAVRERFVRQENSLSLEIVPFQTQTEAQQFHDAVHSKPDSWDSLIKTKNLKSQKTGKIALDAILNLWQIPQPIAEAMLKAEPKTVSEPFAHSGKFSVVRLEEKISADEKKYNEEAKKKIIEQLTGQSRYERFAKWMADIESRANFKDYTPQATPPPAAKTPEAPKNSAVTSPAPTASAPSKS